MHQSHSTKGHKAGLLFRMERGVAVWTAYLVFEWLRSGDCGGAGEI